MSKPLDLLFKWGQGAGQIGRLSLLGGTWILVLFGAGSAASGGQVDTELLGALLVAAAFHVAVYAWNDIFDLPLDRTQPRRMASPLVQGVISTRAVAALASAAAALSIAGAFVKGLEALIWMVVALSLLLLYDALGKRTPFPPLMDLAQGVGWAALVLYAASAVGHLTGATWWIAIYIVATIMVLNGVVGGIRDLPNDYQRHASTTAVFLGARPIGRFGVEPGRRLVLWAAMTQLATLIVLLAGIITQYPDTPLPRIGIAMAGGAAGCLFLGQMLKRALAGPRSWPFGLAHIVLTLLLPLLLLPWPLNFSFVLILSVLFGIPTAAVAGMVIQWRKHT